MGQLLTGRLVPGSGESMQSEEPLVAPSGGLIVCSPVAALHTSKRVLWINRCSILVATERDGMSDPTCIVAKDLGGTTDVVRPLQLRGVFVDQKFRVGVHAPVLNGSKHGHEKQRVGH